VSTIVQAKNSSLVIGSDVTVTYEEAAALDDTHGHIAVVRRRSSTTDSAAATPAGWTLVGSASSVHSTTYVYTYIYARRGDSSVVSITVASTGNIHTHIALMAIDGVRDATFWRAGSIDTDADADAGTTRTVTVDAGTFVDTIAIAAVALSGTAGGTGIGWGQGTVRQAASSAGSFSVVSLDRAGLDSDDFDAAWTAATWSAAIACEFGGGVEVVAALFASLPLATATIPGSQTDSGTLSSATPIPTAALTGTALNAGTLLAAVLTVTAALAGVATNQGTLAASLPLATAQIAGVNALTPTPRTMTAVPRVLTLIAVPHARTLTAVPHARTLTPVEV
jgi:hypothetical protein